MAGGGDQGDLAALLEQVSVSSSHASDRDLAFQLQLAEAIQASPESSDAAYALALHAADLARAELDLRDARARHARSAAAVRVTAHDARFARELAAVPEDRWARDGDCFELRRRTRRRPRSSESSPREWRDRDPGVAVLAAAVCGPRGEVLIRVQKPVEGSVGGREVLEAMALEEGLNAALGLGIRSVGIVTDYRPLRNHVRDSIHAPYRYLYYL